MNSIFSIIKNGSCGYKITGLELSNDEYLDDTTKTSHRGYPYSLSVTLNSITSVKFDGTETLDKYGITLHTTTLDEAVLETSTDGLCLVSHIILPTQVWLALAVSLNELGTYTNIYYYDTDTSKFMKYLNDSKIEVTVEEVLAINASDSNTIIRTDKNTFCMCRLLACFYNKCIALLDTLPKCKEINSDLDIYIRDLIWMAINSIKYSIDLGNYYLALLILERISGCNGLCTTASLTALKSSSGCGCNK